MLKPKYERVKLALAEGDTSAEAEIHIPKGARVMVGAKASSQPGSILDVSLEENGSEIHPPMAVEWYDGGIGSFEQRALELAYQGGSQLTVKLSTSTAIAAGKEVEVEIVFQILKEVAC